MENLNFTNEPEIRGKTPMHKRSNTKPDYKYLLLSSSLSRIKKKFAKYALTMFKTGEEHQTFFSAQKPFSYNTQPKILEDISNIPNTTRQAPAPKQNKELFKAMLILSTLVEKKSTELLISSFYAIKVITKERRAIDNQEMMELRAMKIYDITQSMDKKYIKMAFFKLYFASINKYAIQPNKMLSLTFRKLLSNKIGKSFKYVMQMAINKWKARSEPISKKLKKIIKTEMEDRFSKENTSSILNRIKAISAKFKTVLPSQGH
jgi:hypothetical protein